MRFGVNSLLFTDTFTERDLPLIDRSRELGFDLLEISPTEPDRFPAWAVRRRAEATGIGVNVNYALPEHANPISPDRACRRRSIELSKRLVDLCAEAGAEIYCGANYCAWKYFTKQRRTADEWAWAVDCYREVAEYAGQTSPDLELAIEPLNRFESHFINLTADAMRFVDEVDLPNVKVHLDTFHMLREEDDMASAVRDCGERLAYFHACGSQRGVPGRDMVPWRETLEALRDSGYRGCITLESFHPGLRLASEVAVWREYAPSPERLATDGLAFLHDLCADIFDEPVDRAPTGTDR